MKRRMIPFLLIVLMIVGCLSSNLVALGAGDCELNIETIEALPDETVMVNITLANNPGLIGLSFSVSWDEGMKLVGVNNGSTLEALSYTKPNRLTNGCVFTWYGENINDEDVKDGVILSLNFSVNEDVVKDQMVGIELNVGDAYNASLESVTPTVKKGGVRIIDIMPGDVNGDNRINTLDLILISRYIADGCKTDPEGYNVTINERAANVNNDNKINTLDLILISRYIADGGQTDPQGYNVTLVPGSSLCAHKLVKTSKKDATCTDAGNIDYWNCLICGKYYSDEKALSEIKYERTIIPANGHTIVIDTEIPATPTSTGLTEGSHCSVCGEVIIEQQIIPMSNKFTYEDVVYEILDNGTLTVSKYIGDATEVTIPETVNGYTVVEIGPSAFEGNKTITTIHLPDTILYVRTRAFADCDSLKNMD